MYDADTNDFLQHFWKYSLGTGEKKGGWSMLISDVVFFWSYGEGKTKQNTLLSSSSCLNVCQSLRTTVEFTEWIFISNPTFRKLRYWNLFDKLKILLKSDRNNGYFTFRAVRMLHVQSCTDASRADLHGCFTCRTVRMLHVQSCKDASRAELYGCFTWRAARMLHVRSCLHVYTHLELNSLHIYLGEKWFGPKL
jgi:hypothetical protein